MTSAALWVLLAGMGGAAPAKVPAVNEVGPLRAAAVGALGAAKVKAGAASEVIRAITLPSIERLIEDADLRAASITQPERDWAFVRRSLETARAHADQVAGGADPYRTATGMLVKAYRSEWDGTLQPYALYVPPDYRPEKKGGWPLIVALHGAFSDHRHNLRRVFGLDNRPGETDEEASRNELPLPQVPAVVVSPLGRGQLMGWDGLGGEDAMRVVADVRRAYAIDDQRITLTGLSMGGGGTWQIGLRHPELFAALAPVCAVSDFGRMVAPADAFLYDAELLVRLSPAAVAENARRMPVLMFHGAKDPTVPVGDSRQMAEKFRALGLLGKNVQYTEYPDVGHEAWIRAYQGAELLRKLAGFRRDPAAPGAPAPPPPPSQALPGLIGKSAPRQRPHIYVYGTNGPPDAVAAGRALATKLADWGPMVAAKFQVKADREVTPTDRQRFHLVLVGAAPLNPLAREVDLPQLATMKGSIGDAAFRGVGLDRSGKPALVLGASTPRGFARLQRFARPNRDAWAPEPNRPFAFLPDAPPGR
jgi:pimeloyl-ACP methyl ester carboxylesterase